MLRGGLDPDEIANGSGQPGWSAGDGHAQGFYFSQEGVYLGVGEGGLAWAAARPSDDQDVHVHFRGSIAAALRGSRPGG